MASDAPHVTNAKDRATIDLAAITPSNESPRPAVSLAILALLINRSVDSRRRSSLRQYAMRHIRRVSIGNGEHINHTVD
jgi:hypothetical protein